MVYIDIQDRQKLTNSIEGRFIKYVYLSHLMTFIEWNYDFRNERFQNVNIY